MRVANLSRALGILAILCSAVTAAAQSGRLGVTVEGVRNENGSVRCGLYTSPNGFREPGHEFRGVAAPIRSGRATCMFVGIPTGTYAVAVFHAEQNETRMATGMFGKPKQGFGFSRNPSVTFGPPNFANAAFEYSGGNMNLPVRLNY